MPNTVRVWDVPVRLFHWLLVVAVVAMFVTGKLGGNWMEWHRKIGFVLLGMIAFRLVWGVVGSEHARFANFVKGPKTTLAYVKSLFKRDSPPTLGHSPIGALSVVGMLLVLGFQAVTGLFADDEILLKGPYADAVSGAVSALLTKLHRLNSNLILGLIVLHLAAIAFYAWYRRENLVAAMITGNKPNTSTSAALEAKMPEEPHPVWFPLLIALIVGALDYALVTRLFW